MLDAIHYWFLGPNDVKVRETVEALQRKYILLQFILFYNIYSLRSSVSISFIFVQIHLESYLNSSCLTRGMNNLQR